MPHRRGRSRGGFVKMGYGQGDEPGGQAVRKMAFATLGVNAIEAKVRKIQSDAFTVARNASSSLRSCSDIAPGAARDWSTVSICLRIFAAESRLPAPFNVVARPTIASR